MKQPTLNGELMLTLDLAGMLDRLKPEERAEIIKKTGFDGWLFGALIEMLASGVTKEGWWIGGTEVAKWREALLPLLPMIQQELVRDLVGQRDQAAVESKRHIEWAWAMYQAWVQGEKLAPVPNDFLAVQRPTPTEVGAAGYGGRMSYLDVRNDHLTRSTYEWLEGEADANPRRRLMTTVAPYEYGIFVGVPADLDGIQALDGPEDLKAVLSFARGLGCDVVRFDRDADAVALPSYDWEAADKVAA